MCGRERERERGVMERATCPADGIP